VRALAQLYAARALHVLLRCSVAKAEKKQKSHSVVSDAEKRAISDGLAGLARRYAAAGPSGRAVLTQVVLALATLLIKWEALPAERILPDAFASLGGGGDAASRGATLALLRVLPEELVARELSVHPARRAAAADALRAAAPEVLAVLDAATAAAPPGDAATHAAALDAFAAWCDAGVPAHAVVACGLTRAAFGVLAAGGPEALLQPALSAAAAAASALLASGGAVTLAPLLAALRPAAAAAPADGDAGVALAGALCHAASEAAPRVAACEADAAAPLCAAMDALLDAVEHAPGPLPEPPLAWLTPWGAAREAAAAATAPDGAAALAAALAPAAARLAALAPRRIAFRDGDDAGVIAAVRADFADALRDAAVAAGAAPLLPPLVASLAHTMEPHACSSWQAAEATAFAAAACCRRVPPECCAAAEALCADAARLLAAPPPHVAHPACAEAAAGVLSSLGAWLSAAAPDACVAAAAAALEQCVCAPHAGASRAAAVALMRCADAGAAARLAAAGVAPRLAAILQARCLQQQQQQQHGALGAAEGLREGQEPVATILLRTLCRLAEHAPSGEQRSAALAALLPLPLGVAGAAMQRIAAAASAHELEAGCVALGRALRDLAVLLDASARASADAAAAMRVATRPALAAIAATPRAVAHAGAAAELCGALWASARAGGSADAAAGDDAAALAAAALAAGGHPRVLLGLLQRCVTSGAGVAVALAAAASALAGGADGIRGIGAPLLRLLSVCLAADPAAALPLAGAAAATCLAGTAGEDARAACSLAGALLATPMLAHCADADAGGIASGALLVHALMCAANGALPPDCVSLAADALHGGWRAAGDARFAAWLSASLADPHMPRPHTPPRAKADFAAALTDARNAADARRFKRVLKAFCGGKKKGAAAQ
jgi:hypothetical protein